MNVSRIAKVIANKKVPTDRELLLAQSFAATFWSTPITPPKGRSCLCQSDAGRT
jgi:hypothetical protein